MIQEGGKGGDNMALVTEVKTLINRLAKEIIEIYQIAIPIIDINQVVQQLGGDVIDDPALNEFSDGKVKKTGENSFEIAVSPFQTMERRNFTIAHEIGHLFLHMGFHTNQERWDRQDSICYYRLGNSELEYQANEFAAAFLMPEQEYKIVMDRYTTNNYVETAMIAEYFHVSTSAAANRGRWLGFLEW